jgi:hypothetical protein
MVNLKLHIIGLSQRRTQQYKDCVDLPQRCNDFCT